MPLKIRVPPKKETISQKVTDRYDLLKEQVLNQPRFISTVAMLLVLVSTSLAGFWFFIRNAEKKAWALELEASKILESSPDATDKEKKEETRQEKLRKAAKLYEEILTRYPASRAAVFSQYKGGHVYFELEDYKRAEEKYITFLKKQTGEKELLPLVHLKLAYLYQKKGDTASALEQFRAVYDSGNSKEEQNRLNQDQAGFELARFLEQTGKKSESIEIYKKVEQKFSDSPWGMEAKGRLAILTSPTPVQATSTGDVPAAGNVTMPAVVTPLKTAASMPPVAAPIPSGPKKEMKKTISQVLKKSDKAVPKPAAIPVPSAPATTPPVSVPLQITPEQLRLLHEKGTLTIPLQQKEAPQVDTPVEAPPVPEKSE